ncbi:MAG: class I tRNA ligase family protein, partial [Ignavibacteriaceae bacterium]|nr:class I tRNA ligase family protein [Ignavibacteriaceae bacterium]
IKTTSVANRMIELNKTINWQPPEVGSGRFGNWLEENKDWALSRDRFWATPLPLWVNEDGDVLAVGSVEELKKGFIVEGDKRIPVSEVENIDLHKPFVDKVQFEKDGKVYTRTPELIDVWFDSGAMPFAQYHYPFENKEFFEKKAFPADFICEGVDQTRGWFYTLHAIATMLFDNVAYKNLIVNELILDKNGKKMSKSIGNTVDPMVLFEKYGADATRWYLITNSPPWRPTLFDEDGLVEVQRKFFGTLLNTYAFFALYANIDGFENKKAQVPLSKREEIDRWILSRLNSLVANHVKLMDAYEVTKAARAISEFTIDHLSNWYVRRCRRRFWKSEMNENKLAAYQTLYECLITICKLIAPFTPFLAEELFQDLNSVTESEAVESIHLTNLPEIGETDKELEAKMEIAQHVVYLTRAIRAKSNLKVRQPLKKLMVVVEKNKKDSLAKMKEVILEEVNIKELEIVEDDSIIVRKSAKPNFKTIGPKFGNKVKSVTERIMKFTGSEINSLENGDPVTVEINGENFNIVSEDVEILSEQIGGWIVESENGLTVAVDTQLNKELISEGLAREFVNRIQNMRKDAGYQVTDKINVEFSGNPDFVGAVNSFTKYISVETLAEKIENKDELISGFLQDWKIGVNDIKIKIEKASI